MDGGRYPVNLTEDNAATGTAPALSPDGRTVAWRAMRRPGDEADRLVVMLRDLTTGRTTAVTQDWDRSVTSIDWAHDSRSLYAIALDTRSEERRVGKE